MKIEIDNEITISDPTDNILNFCKKELEIANPKINLNQRLGFSIRGIPSKLVWWKKKDNNLIIPFGTLKKIYQIHPQKEDYINKLKDPIKIEYKSNIKLYDYQEKAVEECIKAKNGILVMPARITERLKLHLN